ncbi:NADPH-dependent FMN reductase [Roseobacter sp. EG26]|uniref:NADPH-dependent FMN reductase n=1 Tax=Roseobacter sp. EG26 TaxID=3412477 RepID=UPI003CE4E798
MAIYKILGLSGSLRKGSTNTLLLREAARLFGDCDFELGNFRLPLYDGDDEAATGVPEAVQVLAKKIGAADAVLIATPEYNKGPSGVLKNALDWISRVAEKPWNAKPVAIMSASAGRAGGERAQMVLRGFMVPFRPRILQGPEIHLANCSNQFDENGILTGEVYVRELTALMQALRAEIDRQ